MPECSSKNERYQEITEIRRNIRAEIMRFTRIAEKMEISGQCFSTDDLINEYRLYSINYTLFNFMQSVITSLKDIGCHRTSETYKSALSSFKRFMGDKDVMLDTLSPDLIQNYEAYLTGNGITQNSRSFYIRILRATYNRAVDRGIIEQGNPFRHASTGVYRTTKRALPLSTLRSIRDINLSDFPSIDYARDMFMLSFYTRGMSFVDMAYLRKSDLNCGYITYRRRKTGQQLTIRWTREMQAILEKYPLNPTQYLLPILLNPDSNSIYTYRNKSYRINFNLKRLSQMVGAAFPITLYCARHSWASAAKSTGIPIRLISEGMGHKSESTTQIYLATLDASEIDRANSKIINAIGNPQS